MNNHWMYCIFALIGILAYSCRGETFDERRLVGDWEILQAKRNGRLTQTLDKTNFSFNDDNTLITNLFRNDSPVAYEVKGDKIEQEGGKVNYKPSFNGDTLMLKTEIQGYDFEMLFLPKEQEITN